MTRTNWKEDVSIQMSKLCTVGAGTMAGLWYFAGPGIAAGVGLAMLLFLAIAFISPAGPTVRFDAEGVADV